MKGDAASVRLHGLGCTIGVNMLSQRITMNHKFLRESGSKRPKILQIRLKTAEQDQPADLRASKRSVQSVLLLLLSVMTAKMIF